MGEGRLRTLIRAPAEAVWDLIGDVHRYPEWDAIADQVVAASDPQLRLGSTYRERSGGQESDWRVTVFEPPRHQEHVGQVPFLGVITVVVDLEPQGDPTLLRHVIRYRVMPGLLRPVGWLIERVYVDRYVRRGMRRTHANARRILETPPPSTSRPG